MLGPLGGMWNVGHAWSLENFGRTRSVMQLQRFGDHPVVVQREKAVVYIVKKRIFETCTCIRPSTFKAEGGFVGQLEDALLCQSRIRKSQREVRALTVIALGREDVHCVESSTVKLSQGLEYYEVGQPCGLGARKSFKD